MSSDAAPPAAIEMQEGYVPLAPRSFHGTGFGINFLMNLVVKTAHIFGYQTATEFTKHLRLGGRIIIHVLGYAQEKDLFEALGQTEGPSAEIRYGLTDRGRAWAMEAMQESMYVGPAPVRLTDFAKQVEKQRIGQENMDRETVLRCFEGLVLPDDFADLIGPAINAGHSLLLHGPPGNGKSIYAKCLESAFEHPIYIPYSLEVDGQVINVFDSSIHRKLDLPNDQAATDGETANPVARMDQRWVRCRRPLVVTGGELTLEMLDLSFSEYSKVYEAPLQVKATNGIFVIDDFGRQRVTPESVLNRWIIPLEKGIDYLTLSTGKKFPVPFDAMVVFSTNLRVDDLFDAATRRRIRYKMEITGPSREEFIEILNKEAAPWNMEVTEDILKLILDDFLPAHDFLLARYQPKWIVDQVVSDCQYQGREPVMELELVRKALNNL